MFRYFNKHTVAGNNKSGIYKIRPRASNKPFMVLCDLESRGGGWTHIQKRFDGSQDFFLNWRDYKFGFGDLDGEFWLGLEHIYLTIGFEVNELLVEITDRDNKQAYAHYKVFGIGSEADGYPLNSLSVFTGDAGDSLVQHLGMKFSTQDFDQDAHEGNCAQMFAGGWWYKGCHVSNLNGKFINAVLPKAYKYQGIHWLTYRGHEYCHSKVRMLVRPARHT
ncbi:hypothetical protein NQ314_001121 [Rhamnusium bicolor]|uniref:Fibrinogen C-terminal domain-containing protein n=1 Tax=Rhamnusium bicolor TaxID=1586634 RepID=A0AAV8ZSZ0_9CUCU|nr:hypothetical protein NQ314_001121 [Rhamnusium bicolor]